MAAGILFGNICVYAEEDQQQHKRLLLVDDERYITNAFKLGLESEGFQVDAYNDPEEALAQYEMGGKYNLVILDIRMPYIDGFQLARKIWQIDVNAKICFLTAYVIYESEAKKVFSSLKDYCFIQKPISIDGLVRIIKQRLLLKSG